MPDTITSAKGLTQPSVGADDNTWGGILDNDLVLIDTALGGTASVAISGNTTLTTTQIQNTGYKFAGTLTGNATITWPSFFGFAAIENNTTGGFTLNCGVSGGTFVPVFNGESISIWSDGTNFVRMTAIGSGNGTTGSGAAVLANSPTINSPTINSPTLASPLSTANGGTGLNSYGALDGTSSTKTSAYTVADSDKRSTISLGGNNCYTINVPAASGFDSDFQVRLHNADSGRAKWLSINGYSSFFLWPNQNVVIQNIGGAWQLYPVQQRWVQHESAVAFYVDPNGSDAGGANDGLTQASAFATITNAWITMRDQTDGPNQIQLTPGATYPLTETCELDGDQFGAFGRLIELNGDLTMANMPILHTSVALNGSMLQIRDGLWTQVNGISFVSTVDNLAAIETDQAALADTTNCEFNMPNGYCFAGTNQSIMNVFGTQKISTTGSMTSFCSSSNGSSILFENMTIVGNSQSLSFTGGFLQASLNSRILSGTETMLSGTGSFTGSQYVLTHGSFLGQGGTTFPGSSGSADSTSAAF